MWQFSSERMGSGSGSGSGRVSPPAGYFLIGPPPNQHENMSPALPSCVCPPPPHFRRSLDCTPVTHPAMPMTHHHPLWEFWDFAVEQQLSRLISATRMGPGKTPGRPGKPAKPGKVKTPESPGLLVRVIAAC